MQSLARRQLALSAVLLACSTAVLAQTPARETPRPQDIDPAVDTSSPSQTPANTPNASSPVARETPRPQDIDPAVDTSSPSQTPASAPNAASPAGEATRPSGSAATAAPTAQGQAAKPAAGGRKAVDRLELDTTQITGNRELPKVLYIVPWKRSDLGDLVGKPVNSLLDEVLTPVDRDVFQRENRYFRALTPGADEGASTGPDPKGLPQRAKPTNPLPAAGSLGSAEAASKQKSSGGSAAPAPGNEK